MSKPVAYFSYKKITDTGLTLEFINTSLNNPTSFNWDFGDGSISNEKNPSHTYNEMGFFNVSLVCSNISGTSQPLVLRVGIGAYDDMLNSTIFELVDHYMPTSLKGEVNSNEKAALIQKWQLYLQSLVHIPYIVEEVDTYNEFKWPGLVNTLIAQLVSYDIILQGANQFLSAAGNLGGSSSGNNGGSETQEPQQVKYIETGPARTEFYQGKTATSESENIKNIGESYSSSLKVGGALDSLKESICQLSSRLRIYLPMCGQLSHNTKSPSVIKTKCKNNRNNANPFGITKKML